MQRRYFEHLYNEICLALERRISRYELWLRIWESGGDPDDLNPRQAHRFVETGLGRLLREEGARLPRRDRARLASRILRFDPRFPTPEEWLEAPLPDVSPPP
ncbi:MAG: hypothetical protein JRF61_23410 [Deltaproteobacteria bacterium]|nr:hypothetical protein [Deltaproteobacteria bacterium]